MRAAVALLLAWVFCSPALQAAEETAGTVSFDHITIRDGLSQSSVQCILQDRHGFLWLGTEDGLNKYDGYGFNVFRHDPEDSFSISHSDIWTLFLDTRGTLWIGTSAGLNRLDPGSSSFMRYRHMPANPHSLVNDDIRAICEDDGGRLWVATTGGLGILARKEGTYPPPAAATFIRLTHDAGQPQGLLTGDVWALARDARGTIWVGTSRGLSELISFSEKEETAVFKHHTFDPGDPVSLGHNDVFRLYLDRGGVLWIGTYGGGLNRLIRDPDDPAVVRFERFRHDPNDPRSLSYDRVSAICEDQNGTLWVGTSGGGLNRFDRESATFTRFHSNPLDPQDINNNDIYSLLADRTGILWVGTYGGGLNKYDPFRKRFHHHRHNPNDPGSLGHDDVYSIFVDAADTLWVGTYGGGIYRLPADADRNGIETWSAFRHDPRRATSLSHDDVYSILEDSRGRMWFGTGGGLSRLDDPIRDRFIRFQHRPGDPESLSHNIVLTLMEDRIDDRPVLWIGTNGGGLNLMDLGSKSPAGRHFTHFKHDPDGPSSISHNVVMAITKDRSGTRWVGTAKGLNRIRLGDGEATEVTFDRYLHRPDRPESLSNDYVTSILQDGRGVLWIGTAGGVNRMVPGDSGSAPEETRFIRYTRAHGLPNNMVYGILEDESNRLWISTNAGLSCFEATTETVKNYDMGDGLQSNEFNGGVCFRSRTGEMFFGGIAGLTRFHPWEIRDNPHVPPIAMTRCQILRPGRDPVPDTNLALWDPEFDQWAVTLTHHDKAVLLEFAALHFSVPEKNRYAYMMEGFDEDWIFSRNRRQVTYTNLDPGHYRFRVKASNNDGVWNETGISVSVTVVPPFWKTWWFRTLLVLSFALFSYFAIHFSRKYLTLTAFWKKQKYVGQYKILDKIGTGGMGTVFKARSVTEKTRPVALKVLKEELSSDERNRRRFKNEASIIDQLDHRNIVRIYERGEYRQQLFLAMEYLQGKTLGQKIVEEGRLDLHEALHIILQVADAVQRIHQKNIIHRDLKPENIMLIEKDGDRNFVKLLDFGLARTDSLTRLTETGMIVGTITYISPEQISRQRITPASDLYALGVLLYEMVTGEKPYFGDAMLDIMRQILENEPIPPLKFRSEIPTELNDLILVLLDKEPAARPTIETLLRELKRIHIEPAKNGGAH